MNIQEAKQEIIHTIQAYTAKNKWGGYAIPSIRQRPLLLIGPPGIGKTAVMEQAAAACHVGFVSYTMTHHTRQSAIGLPYIEHRNFDGKEYAVTEYTMSEIIASVYRCIEESGCREGLLFLDEINCVSETLAPAMLQFLQTKTFGSHRLPEGWVLSAAGNPQEYNKSVREFDIATLDRLKYITVEADYGSWRSYALEAGIHGAILSYLDVHSDQFYVLEQTYSSKSFATARGWEDLSCILLEYESLSLPVTSELVGQYLHKEELARDFNGCYHWYASCSRSLPITSMLEGDPKAVKACRRILSESDFSSQLHLVHLILSCIGNHLRQHAALENSLQTYTGVLERFYRYEKQNHIDNLWDALQPFLTHEKEVLDIRKEHGLSSDEEICQVQQSLYDLQEAGYRFRASGSSKDELQFYAEKERIEKEDAISHASAQIGRMTENSLLLFEGAENAAFTVLLSSLPQNNLFSKFIQNHPSPLFEEKKKRLDFNSREEELKAMLSKGVLS